MRLTTNALIRNYKHNLSASMANLNLSRSHVLTQRKFNRSSEDPAGAARASQLHRQYYQNKDNLDMLQNIQSLQDNQEDALMQISKVVSRISEEYNVQALNSTNQAKEIRKNFEDAIRGYQKSMVLSLNSVYDDKFVFAGSDGKNAPFRLESDGKLTYQGVDVDANHGTADALKLDQLNQQHVYVDLGMGLSFDPSGQVVPSSAFDTSLPGISAVGYGKDSDNVSNNVVVLAGKLADILAAEPFDTEAYGQLMDKFKKKNDDIIKHATDLGVKTEFLNTTKDRLENRDLSLQKQMSQVEGVDMASAITDYSWSQYAYNAALKVGTSILSPSLIDFIK